jgi:hypothetical protein
MRKKIEKSKIEGLEVMIVFAVKEKKKQNYLQL